MRSTHAKTEPGARGREREGCLTFREREGCLTFREREGCLTFREREGCLTFRLNEFILSIFFGLVACLAGCGSELAAPLPRAHEGDETPRRGGTLHLGAFGDIRGLDPASTSDGLATPVIALLFSGLVEYDDAGNLVPSLAERWDVEDGGTTYRFTLREGVRFHDGEELTADDVKRSVERALHPATPSPASSFYEKIAGYDEYTKKKSPHLDGVRVLGRYVVAFTLKEPDATFLPALALTALRPVCKSAGERYSDGWHPCGAGPFKLLPGGWEHGRGVTVVRHEGFFRPGRPYLDAVTWTYGMAIVTERFKLESGALDAIQDFSQADIVRFQNDPRWKAFGTFAPERTIYGQAMNVEMAPFDNVEIRRAVAAAIDREHFRLVSPARTRTAYQVLPPSVPGYREDFPGRQRYDVAAALEHMRRAGYPYDPATGRGGYPNVVPYYAYNGMPAYTAQLMQQDLAKIGLRIEIHIMSTPTWSALTHRRGKAAFSEGSWQMDFPDASDFFEPLFSGKSINDEDSSNTAFYKNARVDALLESAHRELDPKTRTAMYDEANATICDEAPWAFTHGARWYVVWQPYVRGYKMHPILNQHVADVWLDRESARRAAAPHRGVREALGSLLGMGMAR
jgi:ABC-type transport system substrate-binding protein